MTTIKALFCPDFGADVGYGHLTRSVTLAQEFLKRGHRVAFAFKTGIDIPLYLNDLFEIFTVDEITSPIELNRIVDNLSFDVLLIDSYKWLSQEQYFQLSKKCVRVVFDDFCLSYPVDIVINACPDVIYPNQQGAKTIYLLGHKFQILKNDLLEIAPPIFQPCVNKIAVLMGGSDPLKMMNKWILFFESFLKEYGSLLEIDIFCGHFVSIPKFYESNSIKIHKSPNDFFMRVAQSQLAISAGGQTLYELISLGIPTLGYELGVDQKNNLIALSKRNLIVNLGNPSLPNFFETVQENILNFMSSSRARQEMSIRQLSFLDHFGACRIVKSIESYCKYRQ